MNAQPSLEKDTKSAKIMLGVFGVLTLLFVCGGGGLAAAVGSSGSEAEAVDAVMMASGPACCALSGLFGSLLALLAFPTKKTAQIVAPILAGLFGGGCGVAGVFVFFEAIFPAL